MTILGPPHRIAGIRLDACLQRRGDLVQDRDRWLSLLLCVLLSFASRFVVVRSKNLLMQFADRE